MNGTIEKFLQFGKFAISGIPKDAVCSIDVTNRCNLRCHHCYFFEHEQPENSTLDQWRAFFEKLKAEDFPFFSCTWVGGEPLMRKEVIELGSTYFRSNMVVTNGTVEIPDWKHIHFKVSVDGKEDRHNELRGAKTYQKIKKTIRKAAEKDLRIGIATVLTRENHSELEEFVEEWKDEPITRGIIFDFYTYMHGQPDADKLWLTHKERDGVIDRILAIKDKYPNLVEMPTHGLNLLRSENCKAVTDNCMASSRMASFDVSGQRKEKCILGPKADCDRCGCGVPFWLQSVEDLDQETLSRMFGPTAGKYAKYLAPVRSVTKLFPGKPAKPVNEPVLHQISRQ